MNAIYVLSVVFLEIDQRFAVFSSGIQKNQLTGTCSKCFRYYKPVSAN